MRMLLEPFRSIIRTLAFLRAEVFEMLRQPRLMLTLVLGPFLILLLFGIGYRDSPRSLRTLFVIDKNDPLAGAIQQMAPKLGPQLIFVGLTDNQAAALDELRTGQVDVVAVAPPHAYQTVQNNQQAAFTLYHHEIDPVQEQYVQYFGQAYIDEVNRRVLSAVIRQGTNGTPVKLDPSAVVSPFTLQTKSIAPVQPSITQFFAPAVIVLLLQHLAVTFGALSIVRERLFGTMELFRVSPLSALETLVGKYLSYLVFAAIVGVLLTALVIFGLGVPMLGNWLAYALTLAAVLFASLGIGFLISLVSQSESGAVQLAMIVLLATVFFSGFFMRLDMLVQPVRLVSWLLPATYGITLLQDIMLRGTPTEPFLLWALAAGGVVLFAGAWFLLRRQMARA